MHCPPRRAEPAWRNFTLNVYIAFSGCAKCKSKLRVHSATARVYDLGLPRYRMVEGLAVIFRLNYFRFAGVAAAKLLTETALRKGGKGDGRMRIVQRSLLFAVILGWGLGIAAGCLVLWNHAGTPGSQQLGAPVWPEETSLHRDVHRHTLVIFAHPHCPCTRASLRELERLVSHAEGLLDVQLAFLQPTGMSADWVFTDLWQSAKAIPGTAITVDPSGIEARRFGARTSGEALLYDTRGRLIFQGGITPARGHEGDSAGRTAISRWVANQPAESRAPVFGCPLFDSTDLQKDK